MKKCPVCGNSCVDSISRCPLCSTMLPKTATTISTKTLGTKQQIKLCPCGYENKVHSLRCEKCGRFLDDIHASNSYAGSERISSFKIKALASSGEEFLITNDIVLGRQYQKELWDCYTHRAAYHVHYDNNAKVVLIDDLSRNNSEPLQYDYPYQMGRKTIVFTKEN